MVESAVVVRDLVKSFGQPVFRWPWAGQANGNSSATKAVDDISLEIKRNEIFGLLGPNGSGKSTFIRLIATLLIPDSGQVEVFGHDAVEHPHQVQSLINRVSVEASFFKKLSPIENLTYGARLYNVPGDVAAKKSEEILLRLGLEEKHFHQPMEKMSRGMQQKVAIARAFLSQPILLLLDEPTTGLDPRSKRDVQAFVSELRELHDATILLTTHDMNEAENLCDRVAIIHQGKIVALDTPEGLKQSVGAENGHTPNLEEVFLKLTGSELAEK